MRIFLLLIFSVSLAAGGASPNIVWIIGEDMGPELGCYGDTNAITPNMDRLASEGARYRRCFSHAPVCAPSRSGLITGQYPTTLGTHHMRSQLLRAPAMFTERLRTAGYTICWPTQSGYGKTDFNFEIPKKAFDVTADWTKQKPQEPFFGYYNISLSHEGKIRETPEQIAELTKPLKPSERRIPEKLVLPPFYPDAPEVRRDLATYYDLVTAVDYKVGELLATLEKWGIASNTIVILTGDHGRGMPRFKRWVYDSGIHVPLIVRWPGKIAAGEVREDLVSFIDFAPTMLSIAGLPPDEQTSVGAPGAAKSTKALYSPMQGIVFLGEHVQRRDYVFAARDRMDEAFDRIRAVRDHRFKYIRNFAPDLPYAQRIAYNELMPTMKVWRKWSEENKLVGQQRIFFAPTKPREELYDCDADPHELRNLASDPNYGSKLGELRSVLDKWIKETKDMGEFPETELISRGLVADRLSEYEKRKAPSKQHEQ